MAGGYMPGAGPGGGVNGDYLQQLLAAQQSGTPFSATGQAPAQMPVDNSPASLSARYGTSPETVPQWTAMNNFQAPQGVSGQGGANPIATPLGPSGGSPVPAAANPAAPAPSSGGGYADMLNSLWQKAQAYDPMQAIDAAANAALQQGTKAAGLQWQQGQGARGLLPSDPTSQDLQTKLLGNILNPIAASNMQARAGAQGQQMQMLMGLLPGFQSLERDAYQRQRDAANDAYRNAQDAENRRRWDQGQQWNQTQQQWATEDRNKRNAQDVFGQGLGIQPATPDAPSNNGGVGGYDPAAAALARIYGGSGGVSPSAILGGGGSGGNAPMTSGGYPMGGGTGLSGLNTSGYGDPTPGWNSAAGRSGDPNRRPFEGPGTSTVGSASGGGPTTTGSGTTVGTGAPFSGFSGSGMNNFANQALNNQQPRPNYTPSGNSPQGYPTVRRT